MRFRDLNTDAAVLAELGRRLARHRLEGNWTQADLAREAGVGQATVQRAERGRSVQMTSMVRLLRTLGLLEGLDLAIPESVRLPIAQLERERRTRARARARGQVNETPPTSGVRPTERSWTWGDEPGDQAAGRR
ncbi:MAG TPA: helix-turn-helix transcriptional regulator [Solirubrobacteraceae bacterium]|nr:helix-turn-helix transcriptional regulator [Solirubrobacteraceae bacterium]